MTAAEAMAGALAQAGDLTPASDLTPARALCERRGGPLGAVVGIADESGIHLDAAGFADGSGRAMTPETAFDLASVTKVAATTSALHRLVAEGRVAFDDQVSAIIPGNPCAPETTLRMLLQHRAGLWEWQPLYLAADPVPALSRLPLRYPPNTARHYSDLGFMVLGQVVSAVTGHPIDEAVRMLVLEPLGMSRTGFGPVRDAAASSRGDGVERAMVRTGEPYPIVLREREVAWREREVIGEANDGNCFFAFGGVAGHAGLFSTAADLLTLGRSLAAADSDFWGADAHAEVFSDGPDAGQALGWRSLTVTRRGRRERMLWHPGFTGTALGFLPESGCAVVMLTNRLFADPPLPVDELWRATLGSFGIHLTDAEAHR